MPAYVRQGHFVDGADQLCPVGGFGEVSRDTGFQGGRFAPQPGKFDISVNFKGSYQPDGEASKAVDYTRKFLSCTIDLSASPPVTCQ